MNITDLIVELLKEGRRVELPGIGTFDSEVLAPRHDPQTQIYYPATRKIFLSRECSGDKGIVRAIAERECVNEEIAGQMWRNYVDALNDKLSLNGEHRFGDLGVLSKAGEVCDFKMTDGLVIEAGGSGEKPLEGVKTYEHSEGEDPFAQFEEHFEPKPEPEPEPVPVPEPEPEPMPEPMPEPVPEPEPIPEPEPEPMPEPVPEPVPEPEPEAKPMENLEKQAVQEDNTDWQDTLKKLDGLPKSKATLKAEAKAEKAHAKAEKAREKAAAKAEKRARKQKKESLREEEPVAVPPVMEEKHEEKEEKKKRRWLLWLLLLLLLLLIAGGGYYYYTHYMKPSAGNNTDVTVGGKHLDVSAVNDLTYNCDDLVYNNGQMNRNSNLVCMAMSGYINDFLAERNYTGAKVAMMDRVRQYADRRMKELMGDRFAVQRLIPYNDYVSAFCEREGWKKEIYAEKVRYAVQGELMDPTLLNDMLERLVNELGLQQDEKQRTAAEVQQVKQKEQAAMDKKRTAETQMPVNVNFSKNSKEGFDIIAGFYVEKNSAIQMTARLHSQGCDAYVIEKNDGYYVSMGSAPTRTKAEALYNHLKSWYDGDIAIKKL